MFGVLVKNIGEDGQDRLIKAANRFLKLIESCKNVPMQRRHLHVSQPSRKAKGSTPSFPV